MTDSKIQQRAQILQEIFKLKSLPAVSDDDIEKCIKSLSDISDKTFLCTTILKEIDGSMVYFDGVLAILALNLARDVLEKCVFNFLDKPSVTDEKKLFLINLLNQAGAALDPNMIHLYVKNADKVIDLETEKFLQMAEVNPEAQIDFLDFYFGIDEKDKNILLDSIVNDYSGDILANILTPLIYSIQDEDALKMCIKGLLNSKSYLAYAPLEWLIKASNNPKIVSIAKKTKNELKIAGLRKNITTFEYYKELFKNSKPLDCYVSSIDGGSNFSLVFSRIYENGAISTFFAVFNLEIGPISCFGLSNISKAEYNNVLLRFFKDVDKVPLDMSFAKTLIDYFSNFAFDNKEIIPYEFLCWRQLTYDIMPLDGLLEDIIRSKLVETKLNAIDLKRAINSECGSRWFFSYSKKYPDFMKLIDNICALDENELINFDDMVKSFIEKSQNSPLYEYLRKRFLYQAYFFKKLDFKNLSSLFYSINLNDNMFFEFYKYSIKKSVYEFFLNLQNLKDSTDKNNIFAKQRKIKFFDFNAKKMLELIEKKWIN